MNLDKLISYCGEVASNHIENRDIKNYEYSLGKYSVASYIRDNRKEYNFIQKLVIKLFNI